MGIRRSVRVVVGFANNWSEFIGTLQDEFKESQDDPDSFVRSKIDGYKIPLYADVIGDFWSGETSMTVSVRKPEGYDESNTLIKLEDLEGLKEKLEELGSYLRNLGFNPGASGIHCVLNVS